MPDKDSPRVLILEDEPIISRVLSRILAKLGMEADIAENGLLARQLIDSGNIYDLCILDIRTPVISGIQLYEYMDQKYRDMARKVIFMTGDCLNLATGTFLERVNRPWINKPFTPDQILYLIKKVMGTQLAVT